MCLCCHDYQQLQSCHGCQHAIVFICVHTAPRMNVRLFYLWFAQFHDDIFSCVVSMCICLRVGASILVILYTYLQRICFFSTHILF